MSDGSGPDQGATQRRRLGRAGHLAAETLATKGANLVARAKLWAIGLVAAAIVVIGGLVTLVLLGMAMGVAVKQQAESLSCVPGQTVSSSSALVELYTAASERHDLGPTGAAVLASINRIETDFGHNTGPSTAGAVGWMQFMPATWEQHGVDADGDGVADPSSPADAIFSAANYLAALREQARDDGVEGEEAIWRAAIGGYNHDDAYVDEVWEYAQRYLDEGRVVTDDGQVLGSFGDPPADGDAQLAADTIGSGRIVAATVYGGPDDPSSGPRGYKGDELAGTDTYAELGGRTADEANLLGGLPYMTPLLITNLETGQQVTAYKRDFGYGQGEKTLDGHRYAIDLWHETAAKLGMEGSALVEVRRVDGEAFVADECCPHDSAELASAELNESGAVSLTWPTTIREISSHYGPRDGRMHQGIDIPAPEGTPVRAAAPGRVVQAESVGGYGNLVCIQHSQALATCYGHLSRFASRRNQVVERGQVIGHVGNTGRSTGPHLHFEVRRGQGLAGEAVDPMPWLENAEAPATTLTAAGLCGSAIEASGSLRERIVEIAQSQLGVPEDPPGSNNTPYGPQAPWCAMFTTWVWERAGIPEARADGNFCVSTLTKWAKQRGLFKPGASARNAQPGDMVVFNYERTGSGGCPDDGEHSWHVALVEAVHADGTITTINGNGGDNKVSRRGPVDPATEAGRLGPGWIIGYIKPPAQPVGDQA